VQPASPGAGDLAELSRDEIEQRPLVPWQQAAYLPDMLINIERLVVCPVRPPASRWRPVKPLPQPWHRSDPLAEHPSRLSDAEPRHGVEH
jgi:hypothetical protein